MVTRARQVLQYRESSDPKVSQANIVVRTGSMWRAQEAVEQAESRLRYSVMVGLIASGRAWLGIAFQAHTTTKPLAKTEADWPKRK